MPLPRALPVGVPEAFALHEALGLTAKECPLGDPLTAAGLAALEEGLDRPVPQVVRELLALCDGIGAAARGDADGPIAPAARLGLVGSNFESSVEADLRDYGDDRRFGVEDIRSHLSLDTLFAVGADANGDTFFLDLKERVYGGGIPIYRYHHDARLTCRPVARSLGHFVAQAIVTAWGEARDAEDEADALCHAAGVRVRTRSAANVRAAYPRGARRRDPAQAEHANEAGAPSRVQIPAAVPRGALRIERMLGSGRWKHAGAITGLLCHPDGKRAVSCGEDSAVHLWDLATGNALRTWRCGSHEVSGIALSPDGRRVAAGTEDATDFDGEDVAGNLHVFDLDGGEELLRLAVGDIRAVAWAGGDRVVTGSYEGTISVWDVRRRKELKRLRGDRGTITRLAVAADGKTLLAGTEDDGVVRVWSLASGKRLRKLKTRGEKIHDLAFLPDGKLAAVATDNELTLWDIARGKPARLLVHAECTGIGLGGGGALVTRGSERPQLLELPAGALRRELDAGGETVGRAALSADGKRALLALHYHGVLSCWDGERGVPLSRIEGHAGPAEALDVASRAGIAVTVGADGMLRVWDAAAGRELRACRVSPVSSDAVAVSADGKLAVAESWSEASDDRLAVVDVAKGAVVGHVALRGLSIESLALTPDGRTAAIGTGNDHLVALVDVRARKVVRKLAVEEGWVRQVAFSPDGRTLASASDEWLRRWDLRRGKPTAAIAIEEKYRSGLLLDGGARALTQETGSNRLVVWDLAKGEPTASHEVGTRESVHSAVFLPDGKHLVLAYYADPVIRAFDLRSGKEVASLDLGVSGDLCRLLRLLPDGTLVGATRRGAVLHLGWRSGGRRKR